MGVQKFFSGGRSSCPAVLSRPESRGASSQSESSGLCAPVPVRSMRSRCMKRPPAAGLQGGFLDKSLNNQKKPFFKFLIMLCLALILGYTLSTTSLSWWESSPNQWFLHRTNQANPKHKAKVTGVPTISQTPSTQPVGLRYHAAYPHNYDFVMDKADICKNNTPFLVLMVPVAPNNVEARNAIRMTWGKDRVVQDKVVLTLFMLGLSQTADVEKLKEEDVKHRDLIQSNFMDTYLNLTIKTMVIMDWLATRCPTAAYAMKVDSDMFLNIDNLVIMLKKPEIPKVNYLTGYIMANRFVVRSKTSKWYVSEEMYPNPTYPTYTLGAGYVFSNDLPEKYVKVSKSIKPFNIEDAYIGVCMTKLGLEPAWPPNPSQFQAYNTKYNRCQYSKVIMYILSSPRQLMEYWTDLKRPEPPC